MNEETKTTYITPEVRKLIGVKGPRMTAPEPVERGAIRRMAQAIMDDDPIYWDEEYAARSRYGTIVAPPLFPLHACRRPPGTPDNLDELAEKPDYDGVGDHMSLLGLPDVEVGLPRRLNGGNEVEIYDLARVGDEIAAQSSLADIYEKHGRSGPLVFVVAETVFGATNRNSTLLKSYQTHILR
jgi:hypothetical protein